MVGNSNPIKNKSMAGCCEAVGGWGAGGTPVGSEPGPEHSDCGSPDGPRANRIEGVVRGFEIIRAQLQEGHIQRYCAALTKGADHD